MDVVDLSCLCALGASHVRHQGKTPSDTLGLESSSEEGSCRIMVIGDREELAIYPPQALPPSCHIRALLLLQIETRTPGATTVERKGTSNRSAV